MSVIEIRCETIAPRYQLSIFDRQLDLVFSCPDNHSFKGELEDGDYVVAWKIFGDTLTKYKISFKGVSHPQRPVERKIHNGEFASFSSKPFKVGV